MLRDVVYAERIGFRPLSLDLHLPAATTRSRRAVPARRGWRLGSRRTFVPHRSAEETFGRITAAGFAIASADYRLSGEARFPAQLDDVLAALAWLREHGDEHGLDAVAHRGCGASPPGRTSPRSRRSPLHRRRRRRRLVRAGRSHLARSGPDADDPARFDDDPATREAGLLGGRRRRAAGRGPRREPGAAGRTADAPPFLILHGEADSLMPFAQSRALADALQGSAPMSSSSACPAPPTSGRASTISGRSSTARSRSPGASPRSSRG